MKGFLIFLFSKKSRLKLAYAFITLNVIQVLIGVVLSVVSIYICLTVTKNLFSEKSEIRFVFTVLALFGSHIIIQYLVGIKIVERCIIKAHKRSTKRQLHFWLIACANTLINLLILASMLVRVSKHIVRSIRHSMEKGMRHYMSDEVWKHTIDRWQILLKCCGVNGYQDWYELSWLDKYHLDTADPSVQRFLLSKDHFHLPIVPWSCCNVNYPLQCFHDPIQQIRYAHIWKDQPELPEASLNANGCLEVIRYPIEIALTAFILLSVWMLINQILITIVARYLYTSCRNAVILRNTEGDSPGWLFGRGCFGDTNKTVAVVKHDLEKHSSEQIAYSSVFPSPRGIAYSPLPGKPKADKFPTESGMESRRDGATVSHKGASMVPAPAKRRFPWRPLRRKGLPPSRGYPSPESDKPAIGQRQLPWTHNEQGQNTSKTIDSRRPWTTPGQSQKERLAIKAKPPTGTMQKEQMIATHTFEQEKSYSPIIHQSMVKSRQNPEIEKAAKAVQVPSATMSAKVLIKSIPEVPKESFGTRKSPSKSHDHDYNNQYDKTVDTNSSVNSLTNQTALTKTTRKSGSIHPTIPDQRPKIQDQRLKIPDQRPTTAERRPETVAENIPVTVGFDNHLTTVAVRRVDVESPILEETVEGSSWTGREAYWEEYDDQYDQYDEENTTTSRGSELDPVSTDTEDALMLR